MFRIGEFAKLNKISIKTLRYYDELKLLVPIKVDSKTGYRYYSAKQITRLNRIMALKDLGLSLNQINNVIDSEMSKEIMISILEEKRKEINNTIKYEKRKLIRLESLIVRVKEEETFMLKYDVVLKQVESRKVAFLRDVIEDYSKQHDLWKELMEYLEKNKVNIVGACMSMYYDEGYKESHVDVEVMSGIDKVIKETDRIKVREVSKIETAACTVHKGHYEDISMAYNVLLKWIEENQYKVVGPNREMYLEGPWSTESPEEYITEIQIPVAKI